MKRYYYKRVEKTELNLNEGYEENFQMPPFLDRKIDNVLNWIMDVARFKHVISPPTVDFVCSRGTIAKLLCTPYCNNSYSYWSIYASKFRNTIYFTAIDREEKIAAERNADEQTRRKTFWGYKFEQYMTTKEMASSPDLTSRCYEQGMFCIIAKNRIGDHTLLFRAEVDAVKSTSNEPLDTSHYVELKTCPRKGMQHKYSYRPLQWWAQSTVVGIEDIVCGYKNGSGIVKFIKEYKTKNLPRMFQEKEEGSWSPQVCYNFCNDFLNFLKHNLNDDYKTVYRFDYVGGDKVWVSYEEDAAYQIISDKYAKEFYRLEAIKNPSPLHEDCISQRESIRSQSTSTLRLNSIYIGQSPSWKSSDFYYDERNRYMPLQRSFMERENIFQAQEERNHSQSRPMHTDRFCVGESSNCKASQSSCEQREGFMPSERLATEWQGMYQSQGEPIHSENISTLPVDRFCVTESPVCESFRLFYKHHGRGSQPENLPRRWHDSFMYEMPNACSSMSMEPNRISCAIDKSQHVINHDSSSAGTNVNMKRKKRRRPCRKIFSQQNPYKKLRRRTCEPKCKQNRSGFSVNSDDSKTRRRRYKRNNEIAHHQNFEATYLCDNLQLEYERN